MLRNNAEILFFFPLSFHNLASNKTMAMVTVVAIGTQKCQNSKGGEWSSLVELWFKVVGANSHYFFFFYFSVVTSLGPGYWFKTESVQENTVTRLSSSWFEA